MRPPAARRPGARLGVALLAVVGAAVVAGCERRVERLVLPVAEDAAVDAPVARPAPDAAGGDAGVAPAVWNCGPRCYRDPALPDVAMAFAGPGAGTPAPALVYPLAGSVHPINIGALALHFRRGSAAQTLFRARLGAGDTAYDLYLPCRAPTNTPVPPAQDECVYPLPEEVWLAIAAERHGETVTLALEASEGPAGPVARAAPRDLTFSPGPVEGGLYYWSTALRGTYRMVFGSKKAAPFIAPRTLANPFECGGCHALSRDGSTIAFSAEQAGYLHVAPTDEPTRPTIAPARPPRPDGNVMSLNRDGSLVLVSWGEGGDNGRLAVRDTRTGAEVARLDPAVLGTPERRVYFPEWSPDDREIVATLASRDERPWSVTDGYIVVIPYEGSRFGRARVVVPREPGLSHFYPSWSPDGRWIVFASAPSGVRSYDNPQARLRLVGREGGRVYELARATQGLGNTSTWPKFAPFVQAGGALFFVTFNSKLDYGFLLRNSRDPGGGWPQLWMAAIDLRRLPDGDPSSAPVWLPFQDVRQRNHLGFWTERVACRSGGTLGCAEGELCHEGACRRVIH